MPQPYDVELDGAGYMIAPGTYRRVSDGMPEGRTGRVVVKDFFGGQRQALQLVRDRAWDSSGVGPVMGGQGVEPWPRATFHGDGAIAAVSKTSRASRAITNGYVWLLYGQKLYRSVALTAGSWASFLVDKDFGAGFGGTDLTNKGGTDLYCLFGASQDIRQYDTSGGISGVMRAGRKGDCGVGYAGYLFFGGQDGVTVRVDNGTNQDSRDLDGVPRRMALHEGGVAIATRTGSLWLWKGGKYDATAATWTTDPAPIFTQGGVYSDDEDFRFLVSYGGRLYTWLAGRVMEYNPNAGSSRQGWRETGLEGRNCYGATVAGGMLVVAVVNRSGISQLWAWDGSGWWLIRAGASPVSCWPVYLAGAGNLDLLAFRDGATTYDLYGMVYRDATNHSAAGRK
jgi:hypothetical protein